jgi:hypothetical protein
MPDAPAIPAHHRERKREMKRFLMIAALATIATPAQATGPTIGHCLGAFAKSDEPRAFTSALIVGQMGYIKFLTLPEDQRAAYEAQLKADREEAMKPDAPDIIEECYRQITLE